MGLDVHFPDGMLMNTEWPYACYLQVSNLFPRDEMEEILQELIPVMKKEFPRRPPTNEKLYEYFLTRTRANLHVVLCFSPVSTYCCQGDRMT